MFVIDRDEMSNLYRGQVVSEKKIQMWNKRWASSDGKSSHGLWPDELKMILLKPPIKI